MVAEMAHTTKSKHKGLVPNEKRRKCVIFRGQRQCRRCWGGSAGLTGSAGDVGAAVPASAAVRRFGGKLTRKSSISWENWHNLVGKDGGMVDQHPRQVSIGAKPQITQQIERSIQGQFGAIFGENFLENFWAKLVMWGSNPWQPKSC